MMKSLLEGKDKENKLKENDRIGRRMETGNKTIKKLNKELKFRR